MFKWLGICVFLVVLFQALAQQAVLFKIDFNQVGSIFDRGIDGLTGANGQACVGNTCYQIPQGPPQPAPRNQAQTAIDVQATDETAVPEGAID